MAPVKWNGEEQLAMGPSGNYDVILADQFSQAFRALSNEMDADRLRCSTNLPVQLVHKRDAIQH